MFLDSKLNFDEHIKGVFDKTSKFIGLIRKFQNFYHDLLLYESINDSLNLTQITVILSMIRVLQSIFKRNLNPVNIIQLQPYEEPPEKKFILSKVQNHYKIDVDTGNYVFYKIQHISPKYLRDIIPSTSRRYYLRNANNIPLARVNQNCLMNTFFTSTITE